MKSGPNKRHHTHLEHQPSNRLLFVTWIKSIACLLFIMLGASCAQTPESGTSISNNGGSNVKKVLVVNTNNSLERYRVSQRAFIETLVNSAVEGNHSIKTVDLNMENAPVDTLQDILNQHHYDAIYCIGAKALGSIDYIDPESPVIFSSVLNWRRFAGQSNYSGIASEVPAEAQLTWFKYFFPEIKTIGVLYSTNNRKLLSDASQAAEKLAITVIGEEVVSENSLLAQVDELLPKVDALWLISDSTVLGSSRSAKQIFDIAHSHQTPVFSYNPVFVEMGAVLSISADTPTTGRQAALMVNRHLGRSEEQTGIQFPAGSSISLNLKRVLEYKLELNRNALDSVNEIIGE